MSSKIEDLPDDESNYSNECKDYPEFEIDEPPQHQQNEGNPSTQTKDIFNFAYSILKDPLLVYLLSIILTNSLIRDKIPGYVSPLLIAILFMIIRIFL